MQASLPFSEVIFPLLSCCRIYHSPTIPQLICWQLSPGAWNVNKTQNKSDVHCSSQQWVQVLHQLTWFLENVLATLNLACNYNLCDKILVSMVMRSAFLTYLEFYLKKKKRGDDNISEENEIFSIISQLDSFLQTCQQISSFLPILYMEKLSN